MAITVREANGSPFIVSPPDDPDGAQVDRTYNILGTEDDSDALDALFAAIPTTQTVNGVLLTKLKPELEHTEYGVYTGKVSWSKRKRRELQQGDSSYQFETGGGSTHITHSRATIQRVIASGTAPDFKQAIGVSGREIAGCDIITPTYTFSETHVLPAALVTAAYKLALFRTTGKTNQGSFRGFAAGEVLFLGASGSFRGDDEWELTYRFAASENVSGLVIGDLTGINKKGWQYLWLHFEDDVSENTLIKKPKVAIVERVYDEADFGALAI